jgi:hypothetical protein
MGFDLQTTRFLLDAKRSGADFSDTITLGRQNLHIDRDTYRAEASRFGVSPVGDAFADFPFVEGLLRGLGAKSPCSLDASDYEGATHVADLNEPIPGALVGRFSVVIDGGTLEHVFDFRQAAINISKLLRTGGHVISVTACNNFMGHGFYQFSPELFFRVFSPENGFAVESMIVTEVNADGDWYEAADPDIARARVTLINGSRTYMMMRARKTADVEMFAKTPQQSDYSALWHEDQGGDEEASFLRHGRLQNIVERHFPKPARNVVRRLKQGLTNHFASPNLTRVRSF